jgi:hypothetical protein
MNLMTGWRENEVTGDCRQSGRKWIGDAGLNVNNEFAAARDVSEFSLQAGNAATADSVKALDPE